MKTFNSILFACALFMCSLSVFADDLVNVYEYKVIDFDRLINVEEVNRELNDWGRRGFYILSQNSITTSGTHSFTRVVMQRELQIKRSQFVISEFNESAKRWKWNVESE